MTKSVLVQGVYGKVRVINDYLGIKRLYVKRTNIKTYVVSTSETLSLDSMIEINGEFHFFTLKELHNALEKS